MGIFNWEKPKKSDNQTAKIYIDIIQKQAKVSAKRIDIINSQTVFIKYFEMVFFKLLAESNSDWDKNVYTKLWGEFNTQINKHISEHDVLCEDLDKSYTEIADKLKQ